MLHYNDGGKSRIESIDDFDKRRQSTGGRTYGDQPAFLLAP